MKTYINNLPESDDRNNFPCASLVIPFDSKMKKQPGLFNLLTTAADKTEKELMVNYSKERVVPVIKKLRCLIKNMVCKVNEKSIAIFVSPLMKKVYYFTPSNPSKDYFPSVLVQHDKGQKRYLKNNCSN